MVSISDLQVFKGKRVLVTGDTGFKGSWLSLWLHDLGAQVMGYALPPERGQDLFHQLGLEGLIQQVYGDVRNLADLRRAFDEFQPQYLFHLAAQALVRRSYEEPALTYETNVLGSVNVLEAVRHTPSLRAVIFVTSDKCYRNKEWVWGYRESDELGGHDPYSASKAAAELVFSSYVDSYFSHRPDLGIASVRAGNVIGGGDNSADRIVPDCIRSLRAGLPIALRNPGATRPWQHVLEPLSGYLTLAARLPANPAKLRGAWNFGPGAESIHTVRELAEEIVACRGSGEVVITPQDKAPHEAGLLHLSCDKVLHALGWKPGWDFHQTVERVVRWHQRVDAGEPPIDVTRSQIHEYVVSASGQGETQPA